MPKETRRRRTKRHATLDTRRAEALLPHDAEGTQQTLWPTDVDVAASLPELPATFSFGSAALPGTAPSPTAFDPFMPSPPPLLPSPPTPLPLRAMVSAPTTTASSSPSAWPTRVSTATTIVVMLDARGTRMSTSQTTLANAPVGTPLHRISVAAVMAVDKDKDADCTESTNADEPRVFAPCIAQADGSYFVDVNATWLSIILDYLAHGVVTAPEFGPTVVTGVQAAADYLGLYDLSSECATRLARAEAAEESIDEVLRKLTARMARVEANATAQETQQSNFWQAALRPRSNLVPILGERLFS
ncbi:hypothetical protein pclt_cds_890 [Pandoravirus celtis]|uniref:BTB domain-containing protein n=1 Tax=Pandoravirus celtis TaxID=2568002 RepID=A0A4D6EIE1_9VIRU|nr:hypothetical protein pclt_cds_890 [Pandoravirus celtis]